MEGVQVNQFNYNQISTDQSTFLFTIFRHLEEVGIEQNVGGGPYGSQPDMHTGKPADPLHWHAILFAMYQID